MANSPLFTWVHITDTHIGPTPDFDYSGFKPADHLRRLVAIINAFPQQPDLVIHSGDVTQDRSAAATALAADILRELHAPLIVVNGNHDDAGHLRAAFTLPDAPNGDPAAPLDYVHQQAGEQFIVLDASHPEIVPSPQGILTGDQLDWLRAQLAQGSGRLTVLIHYPPFHVGAPWLDENMLLHNGADFHAALLPARERLRGVFFGHLHRPAVFTCDGITYTGAASGVFQYSWRPWEAKPELDRDYPPAYNLVVHHDPHTITLRYAFARPD